MLILVMQKHMLKNVLVSEIIKSEKLVKLELI